LIHKKEARDKRQETVWERNYTVSKTARPFKRGPIAIGKTKNKFALAVG
jgi:hypothetical protein